MHVYVFVHAYTVHFTYGCCTHMYGYVDLYRYLCTDSMLLNAYIFYVHFTVAIWTQKYTLE